MGDGKCAHVWKCEVEGELNLIFYNGKLIVPKTGEKKWKKHIVIWRYMAEDSFTKVENFCPLELGNCWGGGPLFFFFINL